MQPMSEEAGLGDCESEAVVASIHVSEWLTTAEAAAYAGNIGLSTIREACNRNELKHVRIGGKQRNPIRTRKEWISEWLHRWARGGDEV